VERELEASCLSKREKIAPELGKQIFNMRFKCQGLVNENT
jgi:hypothetical protein